MILVIVKGGVIVYSLMVWVGNNFDLIQQMLGFVMFDVQVVVILMNGFVLFIGMVVVFVDVVEVECLVQVYVGEFIKVLLCLKIVMLLQVNLQVCIVEVS